MKEKKEEEDWAYTHSFCSWKCIHNINVKENFIGKASESYSFLHLRWWILFNTVEWVGKGKEGEERGIQSGWNIFRNRIK